MTKKMTVKIAPEALAQLEQSMTEDELQEFFTELQRLADSGELLDESTAVDMDELAETDPDLYQQIVDSMTYQNDTNYLN